jgi:diacylglycerol O-acyltransferase / wax synthase
MSALSYHEMMSSSDALIWTIEKDPALRSTVSTIWFLDAAPTPARMEATVLRMVTELPRMRQRVLEQSPRPVWVDATHFDLDDHYEYIDVNDEITRDDVMRLAESWVAEPFDRRKPLWKLGVITGLADDRAALVMKVHHSMADGVGLVLMLSGLVDFEANPMPRAVDAAANNAGSPASEPHLDREQLTELAKKARVHPMRAIRNALRTSASAAKLVVPNRTPMSTTMTTRSGNLDLATRELPLATLKAAGKAVGGSVNDAFVAITLDAIDRYHHVHGEYSEQVRVHMPINIRDASTADLAGNQFVPARVEMRLGGPNARTRIRQVKDHLAKVRDEPGLPHINTVSALVQRLGKIMSRVVIGGMMKGVDVLASNVQGPPIAMFVGGVRIDEFYAFGPPAGAALNVTLFTHNGVASLGISTDRGAIPRQSVFLRCLDEAIAEVQALAHAPAEHKPARSRLSLAS